MSDKAERPNLLILGSEGAVGRTVLTYLKRHADRFGGITLVDMKEFHDDRFVSRDDLGARIVKMKVTEATKRKFAELVRDTDTGIIVDLSDAPTEVVADVVFEHGAASYVCTAYCDDSEEPLSEVAGRWIERIQGLRHERPHILFSGMNPGVVNVWAAMGIRKFGKPRAIVEFEHDTSRPIDHPIPNGITWSPTQFVTEAVSDPSEVVLGRKRSRDLLPNAVSHPEDLEPILSPLVRLREYPEGWTVMHEECLTLGRKYDVPCRFLYAVNRRTRKFVEQRYRKEGAVEEDDLVLMENQEEPLVGADLIGIRLEYDDRVVVYFNRKQNAGLKESNATVHQVCVGVHAALFTLLLDRLPPGVHFTEDLLDTFYATFALDNLMVEERVFSREGARLDLVSSDPHVDWGEREFIRM